MCRQDTIFACIAAALVAAAFTVFTGGVMIHAERAPAATASRAAVTPSLYDVDRNQKGDRLTVRAHTTRDADRSQPATLRPEPSGSVKPSMPVGCDPAFSPLSKSPRSNFPSRCLS